MYVLVTLCCGLWDPGSWDVCAFFVFLKRAIWHGRGVCCCVGLGRNVTPRRDAWNPSRPQTCLSGISRPSLSTLPMHLLHRKGCRSLRIRIFALSSWHEIPRLALFLLRRRFGACSFASFFDKSGIPIIRSESRGGRDLVYIPIVQHQHSCEFHVIKVTFGPVVRPCLECMGSVRWHYCFRISV
jgi:hypothetical protein